MRRGVGVSVGWSIVLLTLGAIVVVTATSGASPLIANPAGAALQIGIAFVLTFLVVLIVRY
jgi:hypothetical protein